MKITLRLGRLEFAFATASELRDALLAAFPDAGFAGGPFVMVTPDDAQPAWSWAIDLIRRRTDWRPALGIALQHAAHDGGDLARTALADFLANFRESIVELEWTSPLAQRWPDARATRAGAGFGGGGIDPRLADIVADQKSLWNTVAAEPRVFLDEHGPGGAPVVGQMTDAASLQPILRDTANAGRFPGAKGPWSWLEGELLFHTWLPSALEPAVRAVVAHEGNEPLAFLDWMSEECDLWRFVGLLEEWTAKPPIWWSRSASQIPAGWQSRIRSSAWPGVITLGDVVQEALARARQQAATPPVVDLQPRP